MSHRNFIICDSEMVYARNLMERIAEKVELNLQVRVFSDINTVKEFSKNHEIEILLIEDTYQKEDQTIIKAKYKYLITKRCNAKNTEDQTFIYKYQSVNKILEQIFETCLEREEQDLFIYYKNQVKIIGIYSPIHRIGKTTFAIALGKAFGKQKRTLYLNLEDYAGEGHKFGNAKNSLSDLIYFMKQEHRNIGLKVSTVVTNMDELDYIEPIPIHQDLIAVTKEEWIKLLQEISAQSIYETIILDIGDSIQGVLHLLEMCNDLYVPVIDGVVEQAKISQFKSNLQLMNKEEILKKMKITLLPEEYKIEEYVLKLLDKEEL